MFAGGRFVFHVEKEGKAVTNIHIVGRIFSSGLDVRQAKMSKVLLLSRL